MCAHIPLNFLSARLPQVYVFSHCAPAHLLLRFHRRPLALLPVTKFSRNMSTVFNATESRERVTVFIFTFIALCLCV